VSQNCPPHVVASNNKDICCIKNHAGNNNQGKRFLAIYTMDKKAKTKNHKHEDGID